MPSTNKLVLIGVPNEFGLYKIEIPMDTYLHVLKGNTIELNGSGFSIEGQIVQDFWKLSATSIHVYCDNGFEIFDGEWSDARVETFEN